MTLTRDERNGKWSFLTIEFKQEVVNGPPFPVPNAHYGFSQKIQNVPECY
jgi:hypothetical protein